MIALIRFSSEDIQAATSLGWNREPFARIIIRVLQEEKNGNIMKSVRSQQNRIRLFGEAAH